MVLALLLLVGIGNTAFHPQALSLTRRLVSNRQGLGTSVFLVGGEIGRSLGPLAAGFVVSRLGLSWIWLVSIPYLLTVPALLRVVPHQPHRVQWKDHWRPAGALLLFSTVRSATIYEVVTLAPIRWHQTGGSLVAGAGLVTTFIGVGIFGNLVGGAVNDRVGRRTVLVVTTVVAVIALVGFITLGGAWIWTVLGLMGIALFGSGASTMLIGQQIFRENPALGSGVALGLANGLGAIGVIPLTWMAAHFQDAAAVWILVALTVVTAPTIGMMPEAG
jgi:FSR family fosmidomycin resistance protein-like MFS transporter